jgi:hypothetical protein
LTPDRGFIPHWESVDIKVDAPPYQFESDIDSLQFDNELVHEKARSNEVNRAYIRVRNRGPDDAEAVHVKLHWAFAGTALPPLPTDFWSLLRTAASSSDPTSRWFTAGFATAYRLEPSGASSAAAARGISTPAFFVQDRARILSFAFTPTDFDPKRPGASHYCLLVTLDSDRDPVSPASMASFVPDEVTAGDNNITQMNVVVIPDEEAKRHPMIMEVRNPYNEPISTRLEVKKPAGWEISIRGFPLNEDVRLGANEETAIELIVQPFDLAAGRNLELRQIVIDPDGFERVLGGITVRVS